MHINSSIFQGQLIKKNQTDNFYSLGAREGRKKCQKKRKEKCKHIFFVLNRYQSVTHDSTSIFQGLFKNIIFRSVVDRANSIPFGLFFLILYFIAFYFLENVFNGFRKL